MLNRIKSFYVYANSSWLEKFLYLYAGAFVGWTIADFFISSVRVLMLDSVLACGFLLAGTMATYISQLKREIQRQEEQLEFAKITVQELTKQVIWLADVAYPDGIYHDIFKTD